jgi:sterol desaturase/sphingolipid hydroxylase (fatty acid hydroxylase superfamily)
VFAFGLAKAYLLFAATMCVIAVVELAFPREAPMPRAALLRLALFGLVYIAASRAFYLVASPHFQAPLHGVIWLAPTLFLYDLLYYWMHRAQHAIPWLWRFHAVHHAIEKMGPGSGYQHPLESPLKALLIAFPLSLLISAPAGPILGFIIAFQGPYLHSTTRLNFGPFAWIVADNRVHRIHHSRESKHFDRNFGAFTLLWDKLFGTAYFPERREWPAVGLADQREVGSVAEYVMRPFRRTQSASQRSPSRTTSCPG